MPLLKRASLTAGVLILALLLSLVTGKLLSAAEGDGSLPGKGLGKVVIDADSMEADKSKNVVIFKGRVVAREDFTICSDELVIGYDDNNEVTDITASGNVSIFQDDKVAKASKAVYDRTAGTMLLTGEPTLNQCGDEVSGDTITFNVNDESAFVEAGEGGRVRAVIMPEKDCPKDFQLEKDICRGAR